MVLNKYQRRKPNKIRYKNKYNIINIQEKDKKNAIKS